MRLDSGGPREQNPGVGIGTCANVAQVRPPVAELLPAGRNMTENELHKLVQPSYVGQFLRTYIGFVAHPDVV